jgi:hypothetical protein
MDSNRLLAPNGTVVVRTMEEELNCPHFTSNICPRAQSLSIPYIRRFYTSHRSLNGERLVIIGDSLGYELWMTLQCAIGGEVDATIEFAGMAAVPHDSSVLEAILSNIIKSNSLVWSSIQHWSFRSEVGITGTGHNTITQRVLPNFLHSTPEL